MQNFDLFEHTTLSPELQSSIPIVLSSSDYYVPYTSTLICSIINHSTDHNFYEIIIFSKDISDGNKEKLLAMISQAPNFAIHFYNPTELFQQFHFYTMGHFTIESYTRIMMPFVLQNYDKIIYLDCDMVVKADIANLFAIDLKEYMLAAVKDPIFAGASLIENNFLKGYCSKHLDISDESMYFNAGVLLWNIKKFREMFTLEMLLEIAQKGKFLFCDQDVLNKVCVGDVLPLDFAWNLTTYNTSNAAGENPIKLAPQEVFTAYLAARNHPYIIHFAGSVKPWDDPSEDLSEDFWNVARTTPFYEMILKRFLTPQKKTCKDIVKKIIAFILPHGSARRNWVKKIYMYFR